MCCRSTPQAVRTLARTEWAQRCQKLMRPGSWGLASERSCGPLPGAPQHRGPQTEGSQTCSPEGEGRPWRMGGLPERTRACVCGGCGSGYSSLGSCPGLGPGWHEREGQASGTHGREPWAAPEQDCSLQGLPQLEHAQGLFSPRFPTLCVSCCGSLAPVRASRQQSVTLVLDAAFSPNPGELQPASGHLQPLAQL